MKTNMLVLLGLVALGVILYFGTLLSQPIEGDDCEASCASVEEGPEHGVMDYAPALLVAPEPLGASLESRIKAWWKKMLAKWFGDEEDDPVTPDPVTPPAPEPGVPPSNTFLWKPVSEAYSGHAVALLPANIDAASVTCNGETGSKHPRANGNRQHFRFGKTGADYGAGVKIVATLTAGGSKTWIIPNGGTRWSSN